MLLSLLLATVIAAPTPDAQYKQPQVAAGKQAPLSVSELGMQSTLQSLPTTGGVFGLRSRWLNPVLFLWVVIEDHA